MPSCPARSTRRQGWPLVRPEFGRCPTCSVRVTDRVATCRGAVAPVGSCTVTQSPPAARGLRARVPSCACAMLLTIARPRPTPAWWVRTRSVPRRNGSPRVATSCGDRLRAGVLHGEGHRLGVNRGRDPHRTLFGQVVDDCVVHEVGRHLQQERVGADGGGDVAGGLDGDAPLLCERKECLGGFFRDEGEVDQFAHERPLVGTAEQEQCFGEVDRSGVHEMEAVDELAAVPARVVAGNVEQCLGDRQWRPELVGGVGREPLLFGDMGLEPRKHGVERIGKLAELVAPAFEPDPMGERPRGRDARGIGDPRQGCQHPSGEKPPSDEAEEEQEPQRLGCPRREGVEEIGAGGAGGAGPESRMVRDVAQEEHPHGRQQQGPRDHEEAGVAESEFEADAHTGRPRHGPLPGVRRRWPSRCGSRRRARWRRSRVLPGVCAGLTR